MKGFKEKFQAYGADYSVTMERFMGNEAMYMRFLDMLFEDENLRRLGEALEEGNMNDAFTAAHTLKGVAGTMGLTPLYKAICAIVEPLRSGDQNGNYSELYKAVQAEFERADLLRRQLKGDGN